MKKAISIFIILSLLVISGCEKDNIKKDNKLKEKSLEEVAISLGFEKKDFKCDIPVNDIKDIVKASEGVKNYFLTVDNKLYEYSLNKLFSTTNNNCTLADTNGIEIVSFTNGNRAPMDSFGEQYYDNFTTSDIKVPSKEQEIEERYPGYENYLYNITGSFATKENHLYKITEKNIEEIIFENDEKIDNLYKRITFGNNDIYIILNLKTNSNYFECKEEIINKECEQYEDIECKTEFICSLDELTKYKNEIAIYTGDILITKNYEFYIKETK